MDKLVFEAVEGLNAFVEERIKEEEQKDLYYDYKTALKSQRELERLGSQVVKDFKRDVQRKRANFFTMPSPAGSKGKSPRR